MTVHGRAEGPSGTDSETTTRVDERAAGSGAVPVSLARRARAVPARAGSLFGRTFWSLRVRNYRLWFTGQIISTTGTWMQSVAQGWLVLKLTGSAVDLGITVALQFAPVLVFGAYGGVLADRFDKRRVLIGTQTAALFQALVIGLLTLSGVVQLWMVWVLALVLGFINVVDNPTRQSFAVEMVGREDLGNAVALNSVIINSSRIVGPALAGLLIAVTNLSSTFLVNAASFVAVIVCLVLMEPAALHRTKPVPRAKGQVRAGLRFAWQTWEVRLPLLMMAVVGTLGYNFSVILPLLAKYSFHRGAGTYGALAAAMGIGALAGALFAAARNRPTHRLLAAATLAFGVSSIVVAAAPSLHLALVMLVPMGATGIVFVATTNSLLQLYSTGAMRGRVMALWAVVFLGSTPIGGPLTGLVAGRFGPRTALALGGVATVLTAVVAWWALRRQAPAELAGAAPRRAAAGGDAAFARARSRPAPSGDRT